MTLDTADGEWNLADALASSVILPLSDEALLDAIEEVEVTEELIVVAPDRMVPQQIAAGEGFGPAERASPIVPDGDGNTPTSARDPALLSAATSTCDAATAAVPDKTNSPSDQTMDEPGVDTGVGDSLLPLSVEANTPPTTAPINADAMVADAASRDTLAAPITMPMAAIQRAELRRGTAQAVLLGAFWLDALLYMLVVPFLPSRAQALGASPFATSALFAMYAACLFIATPALGWLTDRIGARHVLLLGLAALAAATVAFAYAPGLLLLFAARGAQGVAAAATWTAGLALVAQLTSVKQRPAVFSRILMATGIGTLIGPPLGGLLYTVGGFSAPFIAVAALVVLDGCGRLIFLPSRRPHVAPLTTAHRAGHVHLRQDPQLVFALLMTLAGAALLALAEPSIPLVLNTHFGVKPFAIGLVFGGVALVFILFQPLVAAVTRWVGADRAVAFGLVMSAGALVLEAVSPTALHAEFALIYLALGLSLILLPALEVLTSRGQTRAVAFGALFAAYNLAYAGGQLIGPLMAGAALTAVGPEQGFALLSLIPGTLGFVLFWRGRRRQAISSGRHRASA